MNELFNVGMNSMTDNSETYTLDDDIADDQDNMER